MKKHEQQRSSQGKHMKDTFLIPLIKLEFSSDEIDKDVIQKKSQLRRMKTKKIKPRNMNKNINQENKSNNGASKYY